MKRSEWVEFSVGKRSTKWQADCQPLETVAHVSHVKSALSIVDQMAIKAGLVFDKSSLNTERILVVWLSPNDWSGAGGFRYGNIRFNFDWNEIVDGNYSYWVESIAYGIKACRILLSRNDYTSKFEVYDPTKGDGPWWHDKDNGLHYWNGNYCLEVMIESDVSIHDTKEIDFVDHHKYQCSIDPGGCPDRGLFRAQGGARFIAALAAWGNETNISRFFAKQSEVIGDSVLRSTLSVLWRHLGRAKFEGSVALNQETAPALAKSILNFYGTDSHRQADVLASLFKSDQILLETCAQVVAEALHVSDWKSLL
jgi:hypothetical protein